MEVLDVARDIVRRLMRPVAKLLNTVTRGKLRPNMVSVVGLLAHLIIAFLIGSGNLFWGGVLLIFFGLFDTLDGQLARLQNRETTFGMLLDASADRFKEVMLYTAVAYYVVMNGNPNGAIWAVAACGASLCVSYVKAKGELAVRHGAHDLTTINRMFEDGLMRFEIRITLLVIGLIISRLLVPAVAIIAILSSLTAFDRLIRISEKLDV